MRKKIVAGNWKMNLNQTEALELLEGCNKLESDKCSVFLFSPNIFLLKLIENASSNVTIGAQNGHPIDSGAYTGEVSMKQLHDCGVNAILIGHSERRMLFNENDSFLKEKVGAAIKNELKIFFCCGETLEQREEGKHFEIIINQLENSLFHLNEEVLKNIVIAYEPVWAIGTGKTASADQAEEMHQNIRSAIEKRYSKEVSEKISILYGGSCKPNNANELFSKPNIDGGLIGGASLKIEDFKAIIEAC